MEDPDMNLEPGELNVIDPEEEALPVSPVERAAAGTSRDRAEAQQAAIANLAATRRVQLEGLNAYYGDNHAVRDLNLAFEPGRVTAIIGPSGCGKSTMVRCINRMHEEVPGARSDGRVLLDDVDLHGSDVDVVAVRRLVGMVFQKANPFPTMSIYDNIAAGMRFTGAPRHELKDRVNAALEGAGLWSEVK